MQNETDVSILFPAMVRSVFPDPNFLSDLPDLGGVALPKYLHGVCLVISSSSRNGGNTGRDVDANDCFLWSVIVHVRWYYYSLQQMIMLLKYSESF